MEQVLLVKKLIAFFFGDQVFPKANSCKKHIEDLNQILENKNSFQNIFTHPCLALLAQELLKLDSLHFISLILAFHGHKVGRFTGYKIMIS